MLPTFDRFEPGRDNVAENYYGSMNDELPLGVNFDDLPSTEPISDMTEDPQADAQTAGQSTVSENFESLFSDDTPFAIEQAEGHNGVTLEATAGSTNQPFLVQDAAELAVELDASLKVLTGGDDEGNEPTQANASSPDLQQDTHHPHTANTLSPTSADPNAKLLAEPDPTESFMSLLNQPSEPTKTQQQHTAHISTPLVTDTNPQPQDFSSELGGIDWLTLTQEPTLASGGLPTEDPAPEFDADASGHPNVPPTDPYVASEYDANDHLNGDPYALNSLDDKAALCGLNPSSGTTAAAPEIGSSSTGLDAFGVYGAQHPDGSMAVNPVKQPQGIGLALPSPPSWNFANSGMGVEGSGTQQTVVPAATNSVNLTQGINPRLAFSDEAVQEGLGFHETPKLDLGAIDPDIIEDWMAGTPRITIAPQRVTVGTMLANPGAPQTGPGTSPRDVSKPGPVQTQLCPTTIPTYPQPVREPIRRPQLSSPGVMARDTRPKHLPKLKHQAKGVGVDPSLVYLPLEATPAPWGPRHHPDLFSYNERGEWEPGLKFSSGDIRHYIKCAREGKQPFKIWIQHYPAQRNYRHPNPATLKCRWDECPSANGTIHKGFYRVVFDERPDTSGVATDPFHYAGSMHLHCFEKLFDLYDLIFAGLAAIDKRRFSYEDRNPMSVVEGHPHLAKAYSSWCYVEQPHYEKFWKAYCDGKAVCREIPRERKLWYALTRALVYGERGSRGRMRNERNGNSIDKHEGDLDLFLAINNKSVARGRRLRKRMREETDGEGSTPDEDAPSVKRGRRSNPLRNTRKRAVEDIDDEDLSSDEDSLMAKRTRRSEPAAALASSRKRKKAAAEEADDGELSADGDVPRVKRPRRGSLSAMQLSPVATHITVRDSDEEAPAIPAKGGKTAAREMEERLTPNEDGSRVKRPRRDSLEERARPAATPASAERLPPKGKRKADGEHKGDRGRRPWDADLRGGLGVFKRPKLTRRASS